MALGHSTRITRQDGCINIAGRAPTLSEELEDVRTVARMLSEETGVIIAEFINDAQRWERARGFLWYRGLAQTPPLGVVFVGCFNEVFRMGLASLSTGAGYPIYFCDDDEHAQRIAKRLIGRRATG